MIYSPPKSLNNLIIFCPGKVSFKSRNKPDVFNFILGSIHNLENMEDFYFLDYNNYDVYDLLDKYFNTVYLALFSSKSSNLFIKTLLILSELKLAAVSGKSY